MVKSIAGTYHDLTQEELPTWRPPSVEEMCCRRANVEDQRREEFAPSPDAGEEAAETGDIAVQGGVMREGSEEGVEEVGGEEARGVGWVAGGYAAWLGEWGQ